jgi:single-strand DNA-binding protein
MNSVNLIGRITRDPELKSSSNGKSFVAFTLAVSEFSGGNQHTQFVPCFVWDKAAENVAKFVKKGTQLGVSGSLNVRQNNTNGQYQTIINVNVQRVEFLGSSSGNGNSSSSQDNNSGSNSNYVGFDTPTNEIDVEKDAILFED